MIVEEIMYHLSIILINNINWIVIQREDLKQILKSIIIWAREMLYVIVLRFKIYILRFFSPSKLMFLCLVNFSTPTLLLFYLCFTEYISRPTKPGLISLLVPVL